MEKEKEISIDSLNIKIGGREIELSVAEAKKLKKALEDLFGKEVIHEYHDRWYYRQYPNWGWGTITCDAIGTIATKNNSITYFGETATTNCLSLDIK